MIKMLNVINLDVKTALLAICACAAACLFSVSSAKADLIAQWQFNSYTGGGGALVNFAPDYGTQQATATANSPLGFHETDAQIAGTTINENTASAPNNFAIQMTAGGGAGADVLTLQISGTGLQNFIVTYASQSSSGQNQTWSYSTTGLAGSYTTLTTLNANTTFALTGILTADFSTANGTLANASTVYLQDIVTAGGNGTTIAFDNIAINAVPVPEPTNYALAGFGLMFVGVGAGRFYLARRRLATAS